MSPFILTTFVLLFPFILTTSVSTSIIQEACKAAAALKYPIDYDFCMSSFQADPRSEKADKHELALIAAQLCLKNVTGTKTVKIPEMIRSGNYSECVKGILQTCSDRFYTMYIRRLTEAVDSFNKGNYRDWCDKIGHVRLTAFDCDYYFDRVDDRDPLTADYFNVGVLADLALFLTPNQCN